MLKHKHTIFLFTYILKSYFSKNMQMKNTVNILNRKEMKGRT